MLLAWWDGVYPMHRRPRVSQCVTVLQKWHDNLPPEAKNSNKCRFPQKNGTKNPRYLILQDSYLLKDNLLHCKNYILDGWTAVPSNKSCINVWVFISPLLLSGAFPNSCIQPTRCNMTCWTKQCADYAGRSQMQMQSGHKCKCNLVTSANASHKPPNVLKMYQCTLCAQECEETPLSSVYTMSSF